MNHLIKKFISSHAGFLDTLQEHAYDSILSDHSSNSFPSTSGGPGNLLNDSLPQNTSQLSILSLYISLNSKEYLVNSYHPFFKQFMKPLSQGANWQNPKSWRVGLILEMVYSGWTLIRRNVMTKFPRFKNVEYGTLFNLLHSYIPLVLSIYSISFKRNKFSEYFRAMIRIWIMFTCLQR